MFAINHAATALVVKKKYPQAPLPLLLVGVQLMELLWVALNYLGIERTSTESTVRSVADVHLAHMPYSHSILSTALVSLAAWILIGNGLRKPVVATAAAIAIASHLVLDLLTHAGDIAFAPFMDFGKFGLGLYSVPLAAFVVETAYGLACWWIYRGNGRLLATILGFNLANFTFFSTAIVGPEALLANHPMVLTTIVFAQIVITLLLVGWFAKDAPASNRNAGELVPR
jgi:membrane-bound metal-dependent hydrolase YbcI (DUF457 family)